MISFYNTIVFVKDIESSRAFYRDVLGQKITKDFGTIVFFENHFVIHDTESITKTVFGKRHENSFARQGADNLLIYFETDNLKEAYDKVVISGMEIIHAIKKQEWGQYVFRFYDPDNHIIEIGEPMEINFGKETKL